MKLSQKALSYTYIRLAAEFIYLAVELDAYSRKVVGWALGRTLAAQLAVAALRPGHRAAPTAAGPGAPLRSRPAVRFRGVWRGAALAGYGAQHEPSGQSLSTTPMESC